MRTKLAAQLSRRKKKILNRLDPQRVPAPRVFRPQNIRYELAERLRG